MPIDKDAAIVDCLDRVVWKCYKEQLASRDDILIEDHIAKEFCAGIRDLFWVALSNSNLKRRLTTIDKNATLKATLEAEDAA